MSVPQSGGSSSCCISYELEVMRVNRLEGIKPIFFSVSIV